MRRYAPGEDAHVGDRFLKAASPWTGVRPTGRRGVPSGPGSRCRSRTSAGKAQVAVARSILVIISHLLRNPEARYTDLGYGYYQARLDTDRKLKNHIRQIQALGFDVTLTKAA